MTIDENTFRNMFSNFSEIEKNAREYEKQISEITATGTAGAGLVNVTINGKGRVTSVQISDQIYSIGDVHTVEVLIAAAFNDAADKAEKEKLSMAADITKYFR
ncbi:MAG: YbaB/EbfC family nucleoid-associated protein [Bullifex sp.]